MLDRKLIRENPEFVRTNAARKRISVPVDEFITTDQNWRATKASMDEKKAEMNRISKSIGQLMAQGKKDEAEAAKAS
ncbi:MAG: serine--tRNA ligase, partial [Chthonomonas sp.]|nr:serine--tRNA ligase [Chthonomonas sp.]